MINEKTTVKIVNNRVIIRKETFGGLIFDKRPLNQSKFYYINMTACAVIL